MGSRRVTVEFVGDEKPLEKSTKNVERSTSRLGSSFKKFGLAAAAGLAVGAVAVAKGLYDIGSQFDDAYDKIRVTTGATGKQLDGLEKDFKAVAKTVPSSLDDVSTAIADVSQRLDLSGRPLRDVSKQMLNLSRITETDLGSNIQSLSRVFGDWGIKTKDMSGTMDQLFRATQATGLPVDQLAQSLTQFGGPMRQLGFDFTTTAALLGKFEKEGVNTNLVMGSMRIALGKMAKEGEPARETLMRVSDEIKNAGDASKANKIALELFGAKAGPDMAAAIREGRFAVGDLVRQIGGGRDTIQKASDDTADFAEKWQIIKNRVMVGLEPLATRVFGAVGTSMDKLAPKATQLAGWFRRDVSPALTEAGGVIDRKVIPAARRFHGWIADKIAPAVRSFYSNQLANLRDGMGKLQAAVKRNEPELRQLGSALKKAAEITARDLLPILQKLQGRQLKNLVFMLSRAIDVLALYTRWVGTVTGAMRSAAGAVDRAAGSFGRFAASARSKISAAARTVAGLPGRIKTAVGSLGGLLYDAGVAVIQGLINGMKAKAGELLSYAGGLANSVKDKIKGALKIKSPSRVMIEIGKFITDGLVSGIRHGSRKLDDVLDRMTDRISSMKDKVRNLVDKRGGIIDSFKGMASSVFDSASTKTIDVPDTSEGAEPGAMTQVEVATTMADLLAFGKSQQDQAEQVKRDIAQARKLGLSKSLIEQFQNSGEAGIANLHTIAGGTKADARALNNYDKATSAALGQAGVNVAGYLGVNSDLAKAQKEEKKALELKATLDKIEKHLGKKEVATVTIDNNAIVVAIRKEERKKGKKLLVSNP